MTRARFELTTMVATLLLAACARSRVDPAPTTHTGPNRVVTETVTVRDHDLEQRTARLELRLLEKESQVEELQARLDEARRDVVRSMAKVQSLATRAEAASGMAEAEIALRTLQRSAAGQAAPEVAKSAKLLQDASNEFNRQNYGGALWLANQAKNQAGVGRSRFSGGDPATLRPGEVLFALPLRLQTVGRCNMREGPGIAYRTIATLEGGRPLTGYSYVDQWMRVTDDSGGVGWVFYNLVRKRPEAAP